MSAFTAEELAQLAARAKTTNAAAVAVIKEKCLAALALIDEAEVAAAGLVNIFAPRADQLKSLVGSLHSNVHAIYEQNVAHVIADMENAS